MCTSRFLMRLAAFHAPFAVYLLKDVSFFFFRSVGREPFFSIDFRSEIHSFLRHLRLIRVAHRTAFEIIQLAP